MLRKIRIALAALFFCGITWLLLDFTGTAAAYLGWMARMQFLPAVLAVNAAVVAALVVLTLVMGRIYCSIICPLGVMQDIISHTAGRFRKNRFRYSLARNVLRLAVLFVFVLLLAVGLTQIALLVAPYSAYGRIAAGLLSPIYNMGNNLLAAAAEHFNSYAAYRVEVYVRSITVLATAVATLLVTGVLAWRSGRTYCNTICPVGTILGFFARFSLLRPVIDTAKCNGCGLCARNCKASCIDAQAHSIDMSRCVVCGNCIGKCRQSAISYALRTKCAQRPSSVDPSAPESADCGRRKFLTAVGAVGTAAAVRAAEKTVDGGLAVIEDKQIPKRSTRLIPPGARSHAHFYQHCTACQLCVQNCPNAVLRPSGDWEHLLQPVMEYERGYCRPECTRCSEVCPTGAIRLIDRAEKSSVQIGHAVWVKKNCVVLTDSVKCGNCARHCPAGAITMVPLEAGDFEAQLVPHVDTERCIGCGACENLCPARPFSAIYVEGHETHREI